MYAPIYLPQCPAPSPAVAAAERAILAADGPFHVGERYVADAGDARQERRRLATRRVREAAQHAMAGRCLQRPRDATPRFHLATWLAPRERPQVDVALAAWVRTVHRDTLAHVAADFTRGDVDGALVSAACLGRESAATLHALVRGFPSRLVVGLLGEIDEPQAIATTLLFGHAGVRTIADVRTAGGWHELREVFEGDAWPEPFIRQALAVVLCDLGDPDAEMDTGRADGRAEFFRLVFAPRVTSARALARLLDVVPSTLMSRFFRAGLPSPKQYVAAARLVWAAHLGESPALSIAAIADRLNASSAQSYHRTVRTCMQMSAGAFRRSFSGARMLDHFRTRLVTPYRDAWRTFDPLADPTIPPHPGHAAPSAPHLEPNRPSPTTGGRAA